MIDQSLILRRAISLGEILDAEACAGMLHAEFRDQTNQTVTVESTVHNGEITPIALYLSRNPDTFVFASELLNEQDQHRLATRLSDHLNSLDKGATPTFPLAETAINNTMLIAVNWWQ